MYFEGDIKREIVKEIGFDTVNYTDKNYSLSYDGIDYYCHSNEPYYISLRYCMIVDMDKYNEAKVKFNEMIINRFKKDIIEYNDLIIKMKNNIKNLQAVIDNTLV